MYCGIAWHFIIERIAEAAVVALRLKGNGMSPRHSVRFVNK